MRNRPIGFAFAVVTALALGLFFRFARLDHQPFWIDEAFTSLWLSGHQIHDIEAAFAAGPQPFRILSAFRHLDPTRSAASLIWNLATSEPHQAPLYLLLARPWAAVVGDSIAELRALSALLSVVALPLMYWLARELFPARRAAWTATMLLAVSPLHVLYGQEARAYSLWTVTILLASALLLRALRRPTRANWLAYAISIALCLLTQYLSVLVILAHASYVVVRRARDATTALPSYLAATALGAMAALPWLANVLRHADHAANWLGWTTQSTGPAEWIKNALLNVALPVFDGRVWENPVMAGIALPVVALIAYALIAQWRLESPPTAGFVLTLCLVPAFALAAPDMLVGGRRFATARYLLPSLIGVHLALAGLLAGDPRRRTPASSAVAALLFVAGVASCVALYQSDGDWHRAQGRDSPAVARLVESTPAPLVIAEHAGYLLALSREINPAIEAWFGPTVSTAAIPARFANIFWLHPNPATLAALQTLPGWTLSEAHPRADLWRLTRTAAP